MINLLMYTPRSSPFIPVTHCEHKSKLFELHMYELILIRLQIYLQSDGSLHSAEHQADISILFPITYGVQHVIT